MNWLAHTFSQAKRVSPFYKEKSLTEWAATRQPGAQSLAAPGPSQDPALPAAFMACESR